MDKNTTETVDKIGALNLEGNITPKIWFQRLRHETKRGDKPHMLAINILSELVYWYRPKYVYCEDTGKLLSVSKKFKSDKLQKDYKQLGELFGVSKKMAGQAVGFLCEKGLVTKELRNIRLSGGGILQNVMHLDLVVKNIYELTHKFPFRHPPTSHLGIRRPPISASADLPFGHPPTSHLGMTYTETTTETTSKNTTEIESNLKVEFALDCFKRVTKKDIDVLAYGNIKSAKSAMSVKCSNEEIEGVIQMKFFEWANNPKMKAQIKVSVFFRKSKWIDYLTFYRDLERDPIAKKEWINAINSKNEKTGIKKPGRESFVNRTGI